MPIRSLALSCCALATPAFAAPADAGSDAAVAGPAAGDIVVTARKQSERLQDVPLSMTAIQASTLTDHNQSKLQDYFASVPGLDVNAEGNGQTNLAIRGITTGENTNPAVGIVIDDIPFGAGSVLAYGSHILPDLDPASLSQIEVLRGPQGTLYGASSIGGLLKFDTLAPSLDKLSGRFETGIEDVDHGTVGYDGRAAINVPLTSTLAIRASGFYRHDGGYVDNINGPQNVNGIDAYGGVVSALYKPTDRLTVRATALLQNTLGLGASDIDTNYLDQPIYGDLKQDRIPGYDRYHIDARLFSANITYDFGPAQLTSLTGYGISRYDATIDQSNTFGDLSEAYFGLPNASLVNHIDTKKVSEELRVASTGHHTIEWIVGGFYTHEHTAAEEIVEALSPAGASQGVIVDSIFPSTYREIAVFGTVTVRLSNRLDVQVGGRYTNIRQTYDELDLGAEIGPDPYSFTQNSKNRKATYLVTPRFRISPDLMVYGRIATGYRAGGPNPLSTLSADSTGAPTQFGPDTTTNFELGTKGSLFDRHLSFDISAYVINWNNIQLSLTNPDTGFLYFINGPSARSEGVDGTLTFRSGGLHVTANGSYNDAKLTQDLPANTGFGFSGQRLPYSAHFTGSVAVEQDMPLNDTYNAAFGVTLTHVGLRVGEFGAGADNPRPVFPAYTTLDLSIGVRSREWTFTAFANNVSDSRGVVGMTPESDDPRANAIWAINVIRPRTLGLSIARSF